MSKLLEGQGGGHWSRARTTISTVVVYEAETGRRLVVELAQGEDGADVLRAHLHRWATAAPNCTVLYCTATVQYNF